LNDSFPGKWTCNITSIKLFSRQELVDINQTRLLIQQVSPTPTIPWFPFLKLWHMNAKQYQSVSLHNKGNYYSICKPSMRLWKKLALLQAPINYQVFIPSYFIFIYNHLCVTEKIKRWRNLSDPTDNKTNKNKKGNLKQLKTQWEW